MKRSRMLLMLNNLLQITTNEINHLSYDSYEQVAEEILYMIEEAGMQPPEAGGADDYRNVWEDE